MSDIEQPSMTHNGEDYCLKPVDQTGRWTNQNWSKEPGFVGEITANASHIDGFGHVNNMVYPAWAMEAAWRHSDVLGFPFEKFNELGTGFVVTSHEFKYIAPVLEGQNMHVATWIANNDGRMKLVRAYEIRFADTGKLAFAGETLFITIDMKSGRPMRMPASFAQTYQAALDNDD